MKTPEEYLKDVNSFTTREALYNIGKQIQIDAYNKALDDAAENADAEFNPMGWLAEQHMNNPFIAGEDYEVYVITNSILKLKKQL